MSGRYHATARPAADGGTDVILVDTQGGNSHVEHFTPEANDRLYRILSDLFDAGVARYGSVDAFARALTWYNDLHAAMRTGGAR